MFKYLLTSSKFKLLFNSNLFMTILFVLHVDNRRQNVAASFIGQSSQKVDHQSGRTFGQRFNVRILLRRFSTSKLHRLLRKHFQSGGCRGIPQSIGTFLWWVDGKISLQISCFKTKTHFQDFFGIRMLVCNIFLILKHYKLSPLLQSNNCDYKGRS